MINNKDINITLKTENFTLKELGQLYRKLDKHIKSSNYYNQFQIELDSRSISFIKIDKYTIQEVIY